MNTKTSRWWHPLSLALQLLTRLPAPTVLQPTERDYGRSVLAYPLVGLLIGAILLLMQTALANVPTLPAAALVLTVWVAITGALHLDGLADCVDAWVGGYGNRERSLRILKDPASGPMAVAALVLTLLLKFSALTVLLPQAPGWWLLVAPLLGRSALVAAFLFIPYVRDHGIGAAYARELPRYPALAVLLIACAAPLLLGLPGLTALVAAILVFIGIRRATLRRLGGFTGDVAGTLCELTETVVLLALVF
jgi:adenosylcobinamide-GDP ribazoletransferase